MTFPFSWTRAPGKSNQWYLHHRILFQIRLKIVLKIYSRFETCFESLKLIVECWYFIRRRQTTIIDTLVLKILVTFLLDSKCNNDDIPDIYLNLILDTIFLNWMSSCLHLQVMQCNTNKDISRLDISVFHITSRWY